AGTGRRPARLPGAGQGRRDAVVAIAAPNLFVDVLGDADVEPPHRRQHVPRTLTVQPDVKAEPPQDGFALLELHVGAEQDVHLLRLDAHAHRLLGTRI